jgi:hypothetical protein
MCLNSGSSYGIPQNIETLADILQLVIFITSIVGVFTPLGVFYLIKRRVSVKKTLLLLVLGVLIWLTCVIFSHLLLNVLCI